MNHHPDDRVPSIVVLGAGYAGTAAVTQLQNRVKEADLTWVSLEPYHFVLHEAHRVIREPNALEALTIPVSEITTPKTTFITGEVTGFNAEVVKMDSGDTLSYDYLVVAIGSDTAFYDIPGVESNALTLRSRADALKLNNRVSSVIESATQSDPARIVVGGAGLSGVQVAGEIAERRDSVNKPVDIRILEAKDRVLPNEEQNLSRVVAKRLDALNITVVLDQPVVNADSDSIEVKGGDCYPYDLFIWTGGIKSHQAVSDQHIEVTNPQTKAKSSQKGEKSIFMIGDAAFTKGINAAPPTGQAAWQAGNAAADNIDRAIHNMSFKPFRYRHRGTLLSIGETAIAHGIPKFPLQSFDGVPAKMLKKGAAARWISAVGSVRQATHAWQYL